MRGPAASLLAVAVGLTLLPGADASAATAGRCGLHRAKTVEAVGAVKVLRTRADKLYSCFSPTGKRRFIADVGENLSGNGTTIKRLAIAGRFVAYARYEYLDGTDASYFVDVIDARRGTRTPTSAGPVEALRSDVADPVTRLKLTSDGVAAWIYRNPFTAPVRTEVHQAEGGADALLAAGQTIDPSLLIVSDGLVIWRVDGQLQSAPIMR